MKWYYNMKVGAKLITGFVLVALIAGVIGLIGFTSLNEVGEVRLPSIQSLLVISEAQTAVLAGERGLINRRMMADEFRKAQFNYIDNAFKRAQEAWDIYEPLPQTREEAALWKQFVPAWGNWEKNHRVVYDLSREKDRLVATGYSLTDPVIDEIDQRVMEASLIARASFLESESLLNKLVDINEEIAHDEVKKADRMILAFTMIGIILSILLGIFISNSLKNPINKLVAASERIADGDLNVEIDIDTRDEIGNLARAFSRMAQNVNDVMMDINAASEQVSSGAGQLSVSSQQLSQGATEQASSVEEITSSMEELSSQTNHNASNAGRANDISNQARVGAEKGNQQMQEMLKSMADINESSTKISKIIKVIDEIAFQTNILALNAAVEAARAGQHGKGFAVVAEEVRNLAARSANAAKETTEMIEGSINKVAAGTNIANETAKALETIVEGVANAAKLVGEIATASNEQAMGIEQVNQAIMQVSQVIQTNSATSEEAAAASEELSGQADMLKDAVNKFQLKRSGARRNGFDDTNPDLIKMLGDKKDKRPSQGSGSIAKGLLKGKSEAAATRMKIDLSDKEFGKY